MVLPSRAKTVQKHKANCFIITCTCAFLFGLYVCFIYGPDLDDPTFDMKAKTKSFIGSSSQGNNREGDIMSKLLPQWIGERKTPFVDTSKPTKPNWDLEHWTPVAVTSFSQDPEFQMCRLNFKAYSAGGPHKLPMFKDLVAASQCKGRNVKSMRMSDIKKEMEMEESIGAPRTTMIPPTGFIFHESRVGSTLIANMLGSDPFNMVFSESVPPSSILMHCRGSCKHEEKVSIFRNTVLAMGRSPVHKRVFFKFQSITTTFMHVALEAFPDTPWIFVYRNPVQTMMSHMDPAKGGGRMANCLRSKRNSNEIYENILNEVGLNPRIAPPEASCAAHLEMLCEHALRAYDKFGTIDNGVGGRRGLLLDYKHLPGAVPNIVLPHFGIHDINSSSMKSMWKESSYYSKDSKRHSHRGKAKSKSGVFAGDSEDKEKRASSAIDHWTEKIMQPTYEKMNEISLPLLESLSKGQNVESLRLIPGSELFDVEVEEEITEPLPAFAYEPFKNTHNSTPVEVVQCPDFPPNGYPVTYDMKQILDNWNPDDATIPPVHFDSFCHFDYQKEFDKAMNYRNAEKPFVVYNVPEVNEVVTKWSNLDYLNGLVGGSKALYKAETSKDNHFMYWRKKSKKKMEQFNFKPPTGKKSISFQDWLKVAVTNHNKSLVDREHLYFRITGENKNHYIFKELPFFWPKESLFIVKPNEQRGIHCRFGMKSVTAECHYDGSRNYVASLGGLRRFIINHPDQCENLYLYPLDHPSGRHSEIDWSKPEYDKYPKFAKTKTTEVITKPGDVLYLPTFWFHYIVSLNVNFQCNTRSGKTNENKEVIKKCGF